jgi:predicted metal-binding membrane protein
MTGPAPRDAGLAIPAVVGVSLAAWATLWWWSLDAGGHADHASATGLAGAPRPVALGLAWLVMVVAMMLPLAADLLGGVGRLASRRSRPALLVALAGVGFLAPWLAGGPLLYLADLGLAEAAARVAWIDGSTGALAGGLVAGAGAFQLTGLKRRSLLVCRSPGALVAGSWRAGGSRPGLGAVRLGVAHGMSCVVCCWALMALTVMAAAAGMIVMTFFAAVMLIERTTPWGLAFARAIGSGLVVVGLLWAVLGATA